jgi:DNA-binding beta-propeller fold protein YncE
VRAAIVIGVIAAVVTAAVVVWTNVGASGPPLPLRTLADVPLSGTTSRLDYESFDPVREIMWVAHLGDGAVIAFDVRHSRVTRTLSGFPSVRGVLAVPALGRVYAASQGLGAVAAIDAISGRTLAKIAAGDVDGMAYDPVTHRVYVSDEAGGKDTVIDVHTNKRIEAIDLGGEAGNTQYDLVSHHVFVAVQTRNDLVEIDPRSDSILKRYPLPGCLRGHGMTIDSANHTIYVACQGNMRLVQVDLRSGLVVASAGIGIGPDVLALDSGLQRLYVASESGVVSVFQIGDRMVRIAQAFLAPNAHVVGVDPRTHLVYFPLRDVAGRPVMRIMQPK